MTCTDAAMIEAPEHQAGVADAAWHPSSRVDNHGERDTPPAMLVAERRSGCHWYHCVGRSEAGDRTHWRSLHERSCASSPSSERGRRRCGDPRVGEMVRGSGDFQQKGKYRAGGSGRGDDRSCQGWKPGGAWRVTAVMHERSLLGRPVLRGQDKPADMNQLLNQTLHLLDLSLPDP